MDNPLFPFMGADQPEPENQNALPGAAPSPEAAPEVSPPLPPVPAMPARRVEVRGTSGPKLDPALFQGLLLALILLILETGAKSAPAIKALIDSLAKGRLPAGVAAQLRALIGKAVADCRDVGEDRRQLVVGLLSGPVPAPQMGGVTGVALTSEGYDVALSVGGKTVVVSVALPPGFVVGLANAVVAVAGRVARAGSPAEVEGLVRRLAEGVVEQQLADAVTIIVAGGLSKLPDIKPTQCAAYLGLDSFTEVLARHRKAA